jgi:chromosome segregation ATPase
MNIPNLTDLTPYIPDMILIFISGFACLYCAMLSRRLKNLNNLKTGVGASIISLTQAIEDTHKAAQEAQTSTLQTVQTLRHLLDKSESAAPKIEALISEVERACDRAKSQHRQLDTILEGSLSPAIDKAQITASSLLKITSDINRFKSTLTKPKGKADNTKTDRLVKLAAMKQAVS